MKLSAKKRGQIYDLVHEHIEELRKDFDLVIDPKYALNAQKTYIRTKLCDSEAPLAQALIKLLDKDYK